MSFGCVLLTMGRRPDALRRALDSLLAQEGVELDVAVVGNTWKPTGLPDGVRGVHSPENVGIPAGRNLGVPAVAGELLFFLDDDAALAAPDALARVERRFAADPQLGLLQLRVTPLEDGGPRARDWVPRLRVGDPARSSDITAVWEGAVAMRRSAFEAVGGWPEDFRFVHEGIDLAWRVMDAGLRVAYAGEIVALHPSPTGYAARLLLLLRRPQPGVAGAAASAAPAGGRLPRRLRAADAAAAALARERARRLRGYRDGLRGDAGRRKPLRARTLWRMTRAGRPDHVTTCAPCFGPMAVYAARGNSSRTYLHRFLVRAGQAVEPGQLVLDAGAGRAPYRDLFAHARYETADFLGGQGQEVRAAGLRVRPRRDPRGRRAVRPCRPDPGARAHPGARAGPGRAPPRLSSRAATLWLTAPFFYAEHEKPYDYFRYTQFGLRHLLESAGFEVLELEWMEGYLGTLSYQARLMSRSLPSSPEAYGGGVTGQRAGVGREGRPGASGVMPPTRSRSST